MAKRSSTNRGFTSAENAAANVQNTSSRQVPNLRRRGALWLTAAATLTLGLGTYRVTEARPPSMSPLAFRLEEMMPDQTGIHFVHKKADWAPFFDNVRTFVQACSAAGCVSDVDRNGLPDLYLTSAGKGTKNRLYKNLGGFRFVPVDLPPIEDLNEDGFSTDCVFADVNNDGFDDLLVVSMSQGPKLFLNMPAPGTALGRTFVDVTEQSGLPRYLNAFTATFLDVDNDGDLDLLIAGYFADRYDPEDVPGSPYIHHMNVPTSEGAGRMLPNNWGNATNGGEKHLLRNDGSGHFTEQDLKEWGFSPTHRFTWDIGTADINRDGFTDLYFANDFGPDELYLNQGGRSFKAIVGTFPTDVGRDSFKGMDAEIADINNDGYPEIFVSNIFHPILPEGSLLWLNMPDPHGDPFMRSFKNVAAALGVKDGGWGWGGKFVDLDLDGDTDLVATNGYISNNPKKDYWYRLTRLVSGSGKIISDTKKWPAIEDASFSGFQTTRVFVNEGGHFYDRAADAGITRSFDGRGVLLADFDGDGRVDVLLVPQGSRPFLARNRFVPSLALPEPPSFVGLQLAGDGRRVNSNAVGTRIKITPSRPNDPDAPKPLYREVNAGNGFAAQSTYWIVAGLGRYRGPVDAEVWWTDGTIEKLKALEPGRYHRIQYGLPAMTLNTPTPTASEVGSFR